MKSIVLTQPLGLTNSQLAELKCLGHVTYYDTVCNDTTEWLDRVKGADIIYTNHHGFNEAWKSLHDVFVTLPFVGVSFLDRDVLRAHNVLVARSPGCNRVAVSEWIVGMMLNHVRRLPEFIKASSFNEPTPFYTTSLYGKSVCVIGKGHVGARTGHALAGLGMEVDYYTRRDNLADKVKGADFIVDCLSLNPGTVRFYDESFFAKTKAGAVFVTVSSGKTKDTAAILKFLASSRIRHYITDNAQATLFDTADADYRALLANPNVTITPHIAAYSDNTRETASKMCIENIKAYLAGKPINLV